MDRKSIFIVVVCMGMILSWGTIVQKLYPPPPPPPPGSTNIVASATNIAGTNHSTTGTTAAAVSMATPAVAHVVAPNTPEELVTIENTNARYTFTSHGGGLKQVELKAYPEIIACGVNKKVPTNGLATLNRTAPVAAMTLLGGEALLGDGVFKLTKTANGVRAEKQLANGLFLSKEFQLSTNYLVTTAMRLENRSTQALSLPPQEWVIGTATPINSHDANTNALGVYWYNGNKAEHIQGLWFANRSLGCGPASPRSEYNGGSNDVHWTAVHNQFFAIIAMPKDKAPAVRSRLVALPGPTEKEFEADSRLVRAPEGFQTAFVYPASTLAPGQVMERQYDIFAGPKEYHNLEQLGVKYNNNLDLAMNFGGIGGWFARLLLLGMNLLHEWGLGYGLTIVVITVLIKIVFWPLTAASTRSMKRMSELQPQMKALQEKYKDDQQKLQQKIWEFYKENKVNPLGGCLPMVVQLPVLYGFYTMLQGAIELRGASFLWACDLSSPDTLFTIPGMGWVPFIGMAGVGLPLNLLPLIMGATSFWQASMNPPSPGMDPAQQKVFKYMPLMMVVIFYNFSAGLALYWTVQNLLSVLQTKLTKTGAAKPAAAPASATAPKKKK